MTATNALPDSPLRRALAHAVLRSTVPIGPTPPRALSRQRVPAHATVPASGQAPTAAHALRNSITTPTVVFAPPIILDDSPFATKTVALIGIAQITRRLSTATPTHFVRVIVSVLGSETNVKTVTSPSTMPKHVVNACPGLVRIQTASRLARWTTALTIAPLELAEILQQDVSANVSMNGKATTALSALITSTKSRIAERANIRFSSKISRRAIVHVRPN